MLHHLENILKTQFKKLLKYVISVPNNAIHLKNPTSSTSINNLKVLIINSYFQFMTTLNFDNLLLFYLTLILILIVLLGYIFIFLLLFFFCKMIELVAKT